jgi:hypothetical protein
MTMQVGLRSGVFAAAALTILCSSARATDIPIPGKIAIIKVGRLAKLVAKPVGAFTIPGIGSAGDPVMNGGEVNFFDTGTFGAVLTDTLSAGTWTGLGSPAGSKGWKYSNTSAPSGGAVKLIIMKTAVIKILAKASGSVDGPLGGELGISLETGTDNRCAELGGTSVKDEAGLIKKKDAPAPASCPAIAPFACPGCNNHSFLNFETVNAPGDCGDIIDAAGIVVTNVACAGLYTGGGGNSVPLPFAVPDQSSATVAITTCTGSVVTIGGTTAAETGSDRTCTSAGCFFGHPLAIPNAGSTPTSVCVLNTLSGAASGTLDCATGATNLSVPLSSIVFLTGDGGGDPGGSIGGIQPCPLCSASTCTSGPNNGMFCTAGTSALNPSYPTSHDCPPDPMSSIGTLPIAFALSSGTVQWRGTVATNDVANTGSVQTRVFAGFCRDVVLPGATGAFEGSTPATAHQCWENGMAVGAPCAGTFESCEQRDNGAFGPNGGANRTIVVIGNATGIIGGPAAATLVSIFAIPPTFDATIDAAANLPGPGAVALPGTAQSCTAANPCP